MEKKTASSTNVAGKSCYPSASNTLEQVGIGKDFMNRTLAAL
jgi:hypothetical protein